MKKKIITSIILSLICFIIALMLFNDISFPFLGLGVILLGITMYFFIHRHN